jgi:hypothetical protein
MQAERPRPWYPAFSAFRKVGDAVLDVGTNRIQAPVTNFGISSVRICPVVGYFTNEKPNMT